MSCLLAVTYRMASATESLESAVSLQLRFRGSYKSVLGLESRRHDHVYSKDQLPQTEHRLRLQAETTAGAFTGVVASQLSFLLKDSSEGLIAFPAAPATEVWVTEHSWVDSATTRLSNRVDRAYVRFADDAVELTVGKQVIAMGVGQIFHAVSQAPRQPLVVIDPEFELPQDAVVVGLKPVGFEAHYLPRLRDAQSSDFHLRFKSGGQGFDWALTGGRSDEKPFGGLELSVGVGGSVLRGEIVGYYYQDRVVNQGLLGLDVVPAKGWELKLEAFGNGFGFHRRDYTLEALPHRWTLFRGRWYFGTSVGWEITGRLKTELGGIANVEFPSALLKLNVAYSLSEEWDLELGQYASVGRAGDEFGGKLPLPFPGDARLGVSDLTYAVLKHAF